MGQPVVHFEVMGKDAAGLQAFYGSLFDWDIDANNPMGYGLVAREPNTNAEGVGIGGGVGQVPDGHPGHVTFYVEVPDVEGALQQVLRLGGQRIMGPETVMDGLELGLLSDPEGHVVGLVKAVP
jgi:predicted enzyme related to lactoylglutathione lyase